jgi:hypothetical protein
MEAPASVCPDINPGTAGTAVVGFTWFRPCLAAQDLRVPLCLGFTAMPPAATVCQLEVE